MIGFKQPDTAHNEYGEPRAQSMKTRIRRGDLWPCVVLTLVFWAALGLSRWLVGSALPDVALALLAVVGFIPAYLGILVSILKLSARRSDAGDFGTDAGFLEESTARSSHPSRWISGVPVTASGPKPPETGAAAASGTDKRAVEAGQGFWSANVRASRAARFLCNTCRTKRELDDLAFIDEKGAAMCVACQAQEGGFYRPVPASLAHEVRAILDGIAEP
jgi:hypothetical protein